MLDWIYSVRSERFVGVFFFFLFVFLSPGKVRNRLVRKALISSEVWSWLPLVRVNNGKMFPWNRTF